MDRPNCDPSSPVWLLADSPPVRRPDIIPLDARHPSRHNIWTPILEQIQEVAYRHSDRLRVDADKLYIRNAVSHSNEWRMLGGPKQAL
jgi:hypothetical protein